MWVGDTDSKKIMSRQVQYLNVIRRYIQKNLCQSEGWDKPYVEYKGPHDGKLPHENTLQKNSNIRNLNPLQIKNLNLEKHIFEKQWLVLRGFPSDDVGSLTTTNYEC